MYQLDPIRSIEILEPLGLFPHDFDNPRKYNKIKEIVEYFGTDPKARSKVLQVISGKPGEKLDVLWEYVALQNEKRAKVATLDPKDFEEDIAEELSNQYLSLAKTQRIKQDIQNKKSEALRKVESKKEAKDQQFLDKVTSIEKTLSEVEDLNKLIAIYE